MSALGPMAALGGGQLVMVPHTNSLTASLSLSNPSGIQLRRWRKRSAPNIKCMAFAEEQVKLLDASDGGASPKQIEKPSPETKNLSSSSSSSSSSAESMPLLKPSPKPMMPPSRPKPIMPPQAPTPPSNGSNANANAMRRPSADSGSFSQVYRPKEQGTAGLTSGTATAGGAVQNLDKILQNAEKLGSNVPRPVMRRQPSFNQQTTSSFPQQQQQQQHQQQQQQQQQPFFQTRWKKGDPVTPAAKPPPSPPPPPPPPRVPSQQQVTTARPPLNDFPKAPQQPLNTGFTASPKPQLNKAPPQQQLNTGSVKKPQLNDLYKTTPPNASSEVSEISRTPLQTRTDLSASVKPQVNEVPPVLKTDISAAERPTSPPSPTRIAPPTPPKTPILSSPPLLRPQPVVKQAPQMIAKPVMAPRPPPVPVQPKGPRLVDMFRNPNAVAPPPVRSTKPQEGSKTQDSSSRSSDATKKQPILRDTASGPPSSKPALNKARDDKRKKSDNADGSKRRMVARDENAIDDAEEIGVNISGVKKGRKYSKARRKAERAEAAKAAAPVKVEILEVGKQGMSVGDLARKLAVSDSDVVKTLFMKGIAVTINQMLDEESVKIVCGEYDVEVIEAGVVRVEDMAKKQKEFLDEADLESLERRSPVVTVMGHVDHGKTSLLDYIRKSKVAAGEAGGITQGIGAYQVQVKVDGEEQRCVFLDTPGHQAFSAMRARGARITDIAIIVVAADDGTRPQTLEAIAHAKAAKVPIVVAINKIDKPGANVDRVKEELAKVGVVPPEWGGEEQMVSVSALTGENIDSLLETVMLVAELQDLKSNPAREASGTIIEATLDKARGPVATLLVQNGTLKKGDVVLCGESYGKVRALFDYAGKPISEAGPSTAVQVIGLSSVPVAGDEFEVRDSIDEARETAAEYAERVREARLSSQASEGKVTLASLASAVASGKETGVESHQLNIVLKVDVQGTVEAIREALQVLPQDTIQLRFLMQGTGDITSSDLDLAIASGAIVIGFNVRTQPTVVDKAESEGVEIRSYKVIYELVDDMRQAMEGLLTPIQEEIPIGKAEVRATFSSGSGRVAGCMVTEGKLRKGCGIHVKRGKKIVHTGTLNSLRRVKEQAKEVDAGLECGVGVDGFDEWEEGDSVQAFDKVEKKRTLEDASATVVAALANTTIN